MLFRSRGTYRLSEYTGAGDWVVLRFYAFDFNPICTAGTRSSPESPDDIEIQPLVDQIRA